LLALELVDLAPGVLQRGEVGGGRVERRVALGQRGLDLPVALCK
jgi:hypothetical protein